MKKILELMMAICAIMAISSCTYDYQFPDYTGAKYRYSVADISPEVIEQLLPIAMENGLTLQYSSEKWRTIVTEKDAAGNIIYQGEPRDKVDNNTKILQVSYVCSCRLISNDWNYYDICRFDFEKQFPIGDTPLPVYVSITTKNKYSVVKYPIHTYNIDRSGVPVAEKIHSFGYTLLDVKTIITEKDENGDTIRSFEHSVVDGMIMTTDAKTIDVEIPLYGQPQNYTEKVYVGSYFFKNISLEEINGTTLTLTEDMEHEFVENPDMPYTYNVDRSQLPTIEKINSYGYTVADVTMTITEKDGNGNIVKIFNHRTIDGIIFTDKAKTIDVEIALYGYTSNYEKVYVGSYIFKNISLEEINGTTLTLTEDMEYEFVKIKNEDRPYSYNIDRSQLIAEGLIKYYYGYTDAYVNIIITEKDENGNIIRTFNHRTNDGMIYTDKAKTIDVEIALYGYTSSYEKVYVGSYFFRNISLEEIYGTTLTLTEDMEYEFVENQDL